jgi:hypothetical protein
MPQRSAPLKRVSIRESRITLHAIKSPIGSAVPPPPEGESRPPKHAARRDTGPSAKVRRMVLERDGYACVCCGRSVIGQVYSLQHRKRRSQGGKNDCTNLIAVLGDGTTGCHARIDSRCDPHDEAKGYTVRSWDDPALIPVMVFSPGGSGTTAWLTLDGKYVFEAPAGAG